MVVDQPHKALQLVKRHFGPCPLYRIGETLTLRFKPDGQDRLIHKSRTADDQLCGGRAGPDQKLLEHRRHDPLGNIEEYRRGKRVILSLNTKGCRRREKPTVIAQSNRTSPACPLKGHQTNSVAVSDNGVGEGLFRVMEGDGERHIPFRQEPQHRFSGASIGRPKVQLDRSWCLPKVSPVGDLALQRALQLHQRQRAGFPQGGDDWRDRIEPDNPRPFRGLQVSHALTRCHGQLLRRHFTGRRDRP